MWLPLGPNGTAIGWRPRWLSRANAPRTPTSSTTCATSCQPTHSLLSTRTPGLDEAVARARPQATVGGAALVELAMGRMQQPRRR